MQATCELFPSESHKEALLFVKITDTGKKAGSGAVYTLFRISSGGCLKGYTHVPKVLMVTRLSVDAIDPTLDRSWVRN